MPFFQELNDFSSHSWSIKIENSNIATFYSSTWWYTYIFVLKVVQLYSKHLFEYSKKVCSETIVWWQFFQPTQIGIWIGNLNIPSFHSSTILTYLFYSLLYSNPRSGYSEIKILWWQFIKLHIFSGDWHFKQSYTLCIQVQAFHMYNMHFMY